MGQPFTTVLLQSPSPRPENFHSNVRTEYNTEMGHLLTVGLRSPRPRPESRPNVGTELMSQAADFAARVLASRMRNWLEQSQLPTSATETLNPSRRRQVPTTNYITGISVSFVKYVTKTALVALIVLFVFVLVFRRAVTFMKWIYTGETNEEFNKQLRSKPAEKAPRPEHSGKCVVPANPEHGKYIILNAKAAKPGESFESLKMTVDCQPDYGVLGAETFICLDGFWPGSLPKCVRFCKLNNDTSITYRCLVIGSIEGHRPCNLYEPSGTVVMPECNTPIYYSPVTVTPMRCIDGNWDHIAVCSPECGRVTPNDGPLMIGGRSAKHGELPWHVGIYDKKKRPRMQICGGSLVSYRIVISAAHCFWDDFIKKRPASDFSVAAGKIYRPWFNPRDKEAQKSDVKAIEIPPRFQGGAAHFQEDISVVILETPFQYKSFVRPVCLDFDQDFDSRQLRKGKFGKVAGWGLTAENGDASQVLKVVELPYVDIDECIKSLSLDFVGYITGDKICAGDRKGSALCNGDSGGGLVFPDSERGTDRHYLRGIVSVSAASRNNKKCNRYALTAFTHLAKHKHFIMKYL